MQLFNCFLPRSAASTVFSFAHLKFLLRAIPHSENKVFFVALLEKDYITAAAVVAEGKITFDPLSPSLPHVHSSVAVYSCRNILIKNI